MGVLHPLRIPKFIEIVIRETSTVDSRRGGFSSLRGGRAACDGQQIPLLIPADGEAAFDGQQQGR